MAKIAQIIPYFGKWPEWMDLYLYSCGRNPMIDFIYYTDCPIPKKTYSNTKFIQVTLEEYCKLVSIRLGMDYKINFPYKLTDLKPFLGAIHEQELKEYDYWGFGDIDLCYGDMSMIINERNLKRYKLITTHNYHIAGHCTFLINNEYYRNLCFQIKDWKHRLSDDTHYGFDEAEWSNLIYGNIKYPRKFYELFLRPIRPQLFNDFMNCANAIINPRQLFREFFTSPEPQKQNKWRYDIETGEIRNLNNISLPYLHFLFFKRNQWHVSDIYWTDGFYKLSSDIEQYHSIEFDINGIKGIE